MGCDWRDNIVTLIDLINITQLIEKKDGSASAKMQELHHSVNNFTDNNKMKYHHCAYLWNDSVALLAYIDKEKGTLQIENIMREADSFKKEIDKVCKSYAISVKGQSFPKPQPTTSRSKLVFLELSSYAFKNCFEIEKKLKNHKKFWYIDSRIVNKIKITQKPKKEKIVMYPSKKKRNICMYDNYLWP